MDAKLLAEHGIEANIGIERLQVLATAPPARHPARRLRAAGGQAVRAVHRPPSWNIDDFLAPYETEAGNWMLQLVSQRANGETLIGCPMDYPTASPTTSRSSGLRHLAGDHRRLPGLRDVAIDRMWAGVLPFTSDQHPIVDFVRPGLFLAAGHIFGNAAGPMTGKLVSQMLAGQQPEIDMSACRWIAPSNRSPLANRCTGRRSSKQSTPPSGMPCGVRRARGRADRRRARRRRVPGRPVAGARRARRAGHDDPRRARRSGLDLVAFALVFEELARVGWGWRAWSALRQRHLADRPLWNRRTAGSYLADLAAGRRMSGIALTEPSTGSDLEAIKLTAIGAATTTSCRARRR